MATISDLVDEVNEALAEFESEIVDVIGESEGAERPSTTRVSPPGPHADAEEWIDDNTRPNVAAVNWVHSRVPANENPAEYESASVLKADLERIEERVREERGCNGRRNVGSYRGGSV